MLSAGFIAWARSPCLGHSASQRRLVQHTHARTHTRAPARSAGCRGPVDLAALPRHAAAVAVAGLTPWPVRCRQAALPRRVAALALRRFASALRCAGPL